MKVKYLLLILPLFFMGCKSKALAQTQENKGNHADSLITIIKSNPEYIYSEGGGETIREAEQTAFTTLISKVFDMIDTSSLFHKDVFDFKDDYEQTKKAFCGVYAHAFREISENIVVEEQEDSCRVIQYTKKNDVQGIFKAREKKVMEYYRRGKDAEANLCIDEALRNYYWAYCLLSTLPESRRNVLSVEGLPLLAGIPEKLKEMLSCIEAKKIKEMDDLIVMAFTYKGQPVSSLHYSYFDGRNYVHLYKATNGLGVVQLLPGFAPDIVTIRIEFEFRDRSQLDREVEAVLEFARSEAFTKQSYIHVENKSSSRNGVPFPSLASQIAQLDLECLDEQEKRPYDSTIRQLIECLKYNDLKQADSCFTSEGIYMFRRFTRFGKIHVIDEPRLCYLRLGEAVVCLGQPLFVEAKSGTRAVEYISFVLDPDAKIRSFALGINQKTTVKLLRNEAYLPTSRLAILYLLETFKTAYPLKRLDFIEKVVESNDYPVLLYNFKPYISYQKKDKIPVPSSSEIRYNRNKAMEYVKHLQRCFKSNEKINSCLNNISVMKTKSGGELYAVQFNADYFSQNFGDSGNLLLFLDLNDIDKIQIKYCMFQNEFCREKLSTGSDFE